MSGTRSPSPRAPATEALIVAHGQPSDPAPAEARLRALARKVAERLPDWQIRSATLATQGALERELSQTGATPLVYPFFMSNGWFTETALPSKLNLPRQRLLPPLGLDPSLPGFATPALQEIAQGRGWRVEETEILVASHGSASGRPAPATCAYDFANALALRLPWRRVRVGFLEQDPRLTTVAANCGGRTICVPFFAADGYHVLRDVPGELRATGYHGAVCRPVGSAAFIPDLIANTLRRAAEEIAA